ncbi:MAG: RNase adapter RapZ [Gammaproteobacteria bacterium]|nr:RNase adapter RapZ [Gammaproteobacteria bacterium]MDH5594645.1 RNase adapter RapZ [Gammaproteobacteria bacterium]MDH5614786.1 RNase adapter RapZ [Gammaproteobacteria bacterium]
MKLIIISGLSGSGKSVALHSLEDLNYYCTDNLPVALLPAFTENTSNANEKYYDHVAVGIDARNNPDDLKNFSTTVKKLKAQKVHCEIIFVEAEDEILIKRFSETRRKHPLSSSKMSLPDAIKTERALLEPIAMEADIRIDTSHTNVHQLRDIIRERIHGKEEDTLALLFESFAFKNGIPKNADYVFDARCLPNPHWVQHLRPLTGNDEPVRDFLDNQAMAGAMYEDIKDFIEKWIPFFEAENRSYLTVAIGCTGGRHRSVYLASKLAAEFSNQRDNVQLRHREL